MNERTEACPSSGVGTRWSLGAMLGVLCLCHGSVRAQYAGGSGVADDPYLIASAEQMNSIGLDPNDWDKHFKLMADIDLSAYQERRFNAIGTSEVAFSGVFDGNGHAISNFGYHAYSLILKQIPCSEDDLPGFINAHPSDDCISTTLRPIPGGLFGRVAGPAAVIRGLSLVEPDIRSDPQQLPLAASFVGSLIGRLTGGATVSHCRIEGGQVRGKMYIGGLVGESVGGHITHCSVTCDVSAQGVNNSLFGGLVGHMRGGSILHSSFEGSVSAERHVGGLVGRCRGNARLSHCSVSGSVVGKNLPNSMPSNRTNVGGLVGSLEDSEISDCSGSASVSLERGRRPDNAFGGLVGSNTGVITDCKASGPVSMEGADSGGGGLVGKNGGSLIRCQALGAVSGGSEMGGLVGLNDGNVSQCSAGGPVSGNNVVGGLIGLHWNGEVSDSYARGGVSGPNEIGGLIGRLHGGTISRCYARGEVIGQAAQGGLVGSLGETEFPLEVTQSFWAIADSGQTQSALGVGLGPDGVYDRGTYTAAGWDFVGESANGLEDLWYLSSEAAPFPKLTWEFEPRPMLIYDFNDDPGWSLEGQWAFGSPQGMGGLENGHPDPNVAFTGDKVYGVNLQGDYTLSDPGPHHLTGGPMDFSAYSHVHLQFARWLNSDEADFVRVFIEVSTDGVTWQPVWEYGDGETSITDDAWRIVRYPLGVIANRQPQVFIRWGYHVLDAEAYRLSGWNIDDVQIMALEVTVQGYRPFLKHLGVTVR